ncbi:MAG: anthranilate synthase component I family protein, partial [Phycisphaerae bacterium]|nr:anthranilate synthase component I family protein [Phycisphaerae bacterium]
GTGPGRYSLICAQPRAVLVQFEHEPARLIVDGRVVDEDAGGWTLWRRVQQSLPRLAPTPWSLSPGWVGYVGFEMARQLERLPATRHEDLGMPLLRMALFDRGIVLDHHARRAFAVHAPAVAPSLRQHLRVAQRWIAAASACANETASANPSLRHEISQLDHEYAIARALDYIAAGDIYQVNLAQRLRIEGLNNPFLTYAAIRRSNPAPYAALLRWAGGAVASFSPELFLRLRGDEVLTCPIKGTRPRTGNPAEDEMRRRELLASEKEAAELAMIIDLHRNDLGKVCRYGSVRVAHPRRVEAHPTVFHTVADVVGRLRPEYDGLDLLRACFPAGSISGVPKIRAMQIIDELEPVARGVYTGAVGVLGLDGQMTFNVAIRTLQMRGPSATLYVGGGIVADSEPTAEYEETLAKARGILAGMGLMSSELRVASLV